MGADRTKEILLLDSTLGTGGKLIGWKYGEVVIPSIRRLSLKSGLDIVELGLLYPYPMGPDCTVYPSTLLPSGMERQPGQRYAMLLDREYRPKLSDIPERSDNTVDIIRVFITSEQKDEELSYCTALSQKGYQVMTLLDEVEQYTEQALSALLQEVDAAKPWACYLFDTSGLLCEEELIARISLCDGVLAPCVRLGFHGCDNLQCLLALAQAFCTAKTERDLCIDVSAGGMGAGALHLASAEFAQWMNESFRREYDLPVLTFQETYTKQYLESKRNPGTQLLYCTTAKHKCCYRYAEYYCELSIDISDQLGIYEEIEREFAFRFDKGAANRALLRYRKKRLNLVIVVPTANRWKTVDALLFVAAKELLCYGVDIVIYDSSDDERTHAVVKNFQIDGYDNVHYKRYFGDVKEFGLDEKVISAYQEHLSYDYIWVCRDGLIPTISKFYDELISDVYAGMEWIVIDGAFRNHNRYLSKQYDDCLKFFEDNSMRTTVLGTSIFKSSTIKRVVENWPVDERNIGWWLPIAPLWELSRGFFPVSLIIGDVFTDNLAVSRFLGAGTLITWTENWFNAINRLPEVYGQGKTSALKVVMSDFHPFHLHSLLSLRAGGAFSIPQYKKHRERLSQMSDTPKWKFYLAAMIPRSLAKSVLRLNEYITAHPNFWISRIFGKLFSYYVRLGG